MKEYIEREALYSEIIPHYKSANAFGSSRNVCKTWGKVLDMVQNAPAADVVERKRGEWEWFEEWNPSTPDHPRECEDCGWRCGKCKTSLEDVVGGYWDDPTEKPKLNFCPNCGADMREVDHDRETRI